MNAGVALLIGLGGAAAFAATIKAGETERLTVEEVRELARLTVERDFPRVDPLMVRAIVEIESDRNPRAVRPEPRINDASAGLMQTLLSLRRTSARRGSEPISNSPICSTPRSRPISGRRCSIGCAHGAACIGRIGGSSRATMAGRATSRPPQSAISPAIARPRRDWRRMMNAFEFVALLIGGSYAVGNIGLLVRIASRLGHIEASVKGANSRLDKHDKRLRDMERSHGRILREVK